LKKNKWTFALLALFLFACGAPAFASSTLEAPQFPGGSPVPQETLVIPNTGSIPQPTQVAESTSTIALPILPGTCKPSYNFDFEQQAVILINKYRSDNGLPPLEWNETLAEVSRDHSADMACFRYASHYGRDGSNPGTRMRAKGYAWTYFGENIAGGYGSPERAVEGWMSSPHHRANILNPKFTQIGVGFAELEGSPYHWYWTADFAVP